MKFLKIFLILLFLGCTQEGEILDVVKDQQVKDIKDLYLPDSLKDKKEDAPSFPDIKEDKTPPEVLSTSPKDGEMGVKIPFEIKVTFNEPVRPETIDKNTFRVRDVFDEEVKGVYKYDDKTNTAIFTPLKPPDQLFFYASPYKVTLTKVIQDKNSNHLKKDYFFIFSSELPPKMEKYYEIAKKYSPVIYQGTLKESPQFDYITSFDFDGDLNGKNNVDSIKTVTQVKSTVYFGVVESKSHYFITYTFFHPYRFTEDESFQSGNDTSGAMVVVAKYPFMEPVAILTYFRYKQNEDIRSYVTQEGGIVGEKGKNYYGVNWVFKKDTLFPDGHYLSYVTGRSHESCLWIHTEKENILDTHCELNEGIKTSLTKVKYILKDMPDVIKKIGDKFPENLDNVGYVLTDILSEFWARRHLIGEDKIFVNTFKYEPVENRPGGGLELPGIFVEPVNPQQNNHGKPPWAWKWSKAIPSPDFYFYELPRGMFFLDPAYFFAKRHRIEKPFDLQTKQGFSLEYCFNPYLFIDKRDEPSCK